MSASEAAASFRDIEDVASRSHPGFRRRGACAFTSDVSDTQVVVVQEMHGREAGEENEAIKALRSNVERHGVTVHAIVLVEPGAIAACVDGLDRRESCRACFLAGRLPLLAEWRAALPELPLSAATKLDRAELLEWLASEVARVAELPVSDVDHRKPFVDYAIDSCEAASLSGELERRLGRRVPPTAFYDHPSIEALVDAVTSDVPAPPRSPVSVPASTEDPVAIVGMGCRFPGAPGVASFWALLERGQEGVTEVPADRFDVEAFYDPSPRTKGKLNTRRGGFLRDVDQFDPRFFGISPREAAWMDPQQRLLLEIAWEAFEDAGIIATEIAGSETGVFIGMSASEYGHVALDDVDALDVYAASGAALSIAANRISYFFDLRGPSMVVDTACSSGLVAVHLACESLRRGETGLALAGAANLILSPNLTVNFSMAGATSPDGRCKPFDASADGVVRSEGAGMVLLKPLSAALADGDPIYALIRASAANQDGRSNGLAAPSREAQEALLREAYRRAGVRPGDVTYVEAHGTGTWLGDPIEAKAMMNVLEDGRGGQGPCYVGSVKGNLGHLEAAAGIAGLIKTTLALRYGVIPPSLNCTKPNPLIPFDELPLRVAREAVQWRGSGLAPIAGVSAFGFGGTNAHVVLQAAPLATEDETDRVGCEHPETYLLPVSAHTKEALAERVRDFHARLETCDDDEFHDICFTASTRRTSHPHRVAATAGGRAEMAAKLAAHLQGRIVEGVSSGGPELRRCRKTAFVYSGQGCAWAGMGRALLEREAVFAAAVHRCGEALLGHSDISLVDELGRGEASRLESDVEISQLAIFAVQVGLTELLRAYGVEPAAVVGHSMGEITAAWAAGALDLEEAVGILLIRGRMMRTGLGLIPDSGMSVVFLSPEEAKDAVAPFEGRVSIAGHNSPSSVLVAGEIAGLEEFERLLTRRRVFFKRLRVPGAGHSPQVEPLQPMMRGLLTDLEGRRPQVAFHSSVTGRHEPELRLDGEYCARNLREPVRFAEAIASAADFGCVDFIEVSPHPVLTPFISETLEGRADGSTATSLLRRDRPERESIREALGGLWARGVDLEWKRLLARGRCVPLPGYPWQRMRCWIDGASEVGARSRITPDARGEEDAMKKNGRHTRAADPDGPHYFEFDLDTDLAPEGVRFAGASMAAFGFAADALEAAGREALDDEYVDLADLEYHRPLHLDRARRRAQVILPAQGTDGSFRLYTLPARSGDGFPVLHASGRIVPRTAEAAAGGPSALPAIRQADSDGLEGADFYRECAELGVDWGPGLRCVERIWTQPGQALAEITVPERFVGTEPRALPGVLIEAALQASYAAAASDGVAFVGLLPEAIARASLCGTLPSKLFARVQVADAVSRETDVCFLDQRGRVVAVVEGLRTRQVRHGWSHAATGLDACLYEVAWQPGEHQAPEDLSRAALDVGDTAWLVLHHGTALGRELDEMMTAHGSRCIVAELRNGEATLGPNGYGIGPARADHCLQLFSRIRDAGATTIGGIAYVLADPPDEAHGESVPELTEASCANVMALVQGLVHSELTPPRLCLVTQGAQSIVAAPGRVRPEHAAVWGLAKTIAIEHPEFQCTRIDLSGSRRAGEVSALVRELMLRAPEEQVALRGDARYVARLVPAPPPVTGEDDSPRPVPSFRRDATYLVTGGVGGLGSTVARWMVALGCRHLVLTGRTGAGGQALAEELREKGAEVRIERVDVSDADAMSGLFARIDAEMPPLRGIFHAAGVLADGTIMELDAAKMSRALAPKVRGAWELHQRSLERPLDFFVLFSSAASLLGSPGQANYAAGNAFLDALAHHRRVRGHAALSVNWGPWSEVGGADRMERAGRLDLPGFGRTRPDEGLEILERLLERGSVQIGVLPVSWHALRESFPLLEGSSWLSAVAPSAPSPEHPPRPPASDLDRATVMAAPPERRHALIEDAVRAEVARALGIDAAELDVEAPIIGLGLDSLMAVELRGRLEGSFDVFISVVKFLRGLNVAQLAQHVLEQIELPETGKCPRTAAAPGNGAAAEVRAGSGRTEAERVLQQLDVLSEGEVDTLLERYSNDSGMSCEGRTIDGSKQEPI